MFTVGSFKSKKAKEGFSLRICSSTWNLTSIDIKPAQISPP